MQGNVSHVTEISAICGAESIVFAVKEEAAVIDQRTDFKAVIDGEFCIFTDRDIAAGEVHSRLDIFACLHFLIFCHPVPMRNGEIVLDSKRCIICDLDFNILPGFSRCTVGSGNNDATSHRFRQSSSDRLKTCAIGGNTISSSAVDGNICIDVQGAIVRIQINSEIRSTVHIFTEIREGDGIDVIRIGEFAYRDRTRIQSRGIRIGIRDRFAEGDFAVVGIHNIIRGRNSQGFCFGSDGYVAGEGNAVVLVVGIGQGALRDLMGHVVEAQCTAEGDIQRIAIGIRHGVSEAARIGSTLIGIRRNGNCLTIDRKCTVLRLDFVVAADLFRHGGSDRDSISSCIFTGCTIQGDRDGIRTDQPHGSLISELFRIGFAIGLAGVVRLDGHRCLVDRERDFFRITGRRLDPVSSAFGNVEDRAVSQRNESAFRSGIGFLQFPAESFQRLIAGDHITGAVADGDDGIAEFRAVRECQIIDRGRDQIDTGGGFILGVVQDAHMEQFFRIGSVDDRHIFKCNAADRRGGGSGSTGIRDGEGSEAGGIAPDRGIGGSKVLDDLGRRGAAHYLDTVFQRQFTVVPADHVLGAGAIVDHIAQRAGGSVFRTGKDQRTVVGEGAAVEIAVHIQCCTGRKVCCCGSHTAGSDK